MAEALRPGDPRWAGRYELIGRLGSGGMGDVFLGRSPGGRPVAVKVIRAELLAANPDFRLRFAREVAAAREVNALFTAPVVDADPAAQMPWLVTAYVPGPSLADAVEDHGPLRPGVVMALAAGLAEGLAAIHAAGVVHRDLKPSNVLLASDGPRIIDFGISRAVQLTALTATGMFVGSPAFMSPEQAAGNEIGPASDVFSLGSVLTFAAAGHGPFGGDSVPALFYQVVSGQPKLEGISADLRPLVERCLAKEPADRPTPEQVIAELGPTGLLHDWLPPAVAATLVRYDLQNLGGQDQPQPPVATAPAAPLATQPPGPPPATRPPATRPTSFAPTTTPAPGPAATPPQYQPQSQLPQSQPVRPAPVFQPYQPYRPPAPVPVRPQFAPPPARPASPARSGPLPREYRFGWLALPLLLLAVTAAYVVPVETYSVLAVAFLVTVLASRVAGLALRIRRHRTGGLAGLAGLAIRCVITDVASTVGLLLLAVGAVAVSVDYLLPAIGPGPASAYRKALNTSGPANPFATPAQAAYFLHLFLPLAVLAVAAIVLLRTRADLRRPLALPRAAKLINSQPASVRAAVAAVPIALAVVLVALNGGLAPGQLPSGAICTIGHFTCNSAAHLHFR
ncbi:MAG TPA: serine/threonine-protein kinase [Streptosporangiaceae bacterium]|nr:serine/threonine-protein kinase [Streptosporangiaceae bacterium]